MSIYKQLTFALWRLNADGTRTFISSTTLPRSTFITSTSTAKIYGDDSSTWGSVASIQSHTQLVCNRTKATTGGIDIWGIR